MKYYKFSKRFFLIRAFEALVLLFGAVIIPPFIILTIISLLFETIQDFGINQMPKFMVVLLMIISLAATIYLLIKFIFTKKGVYLCEHSMLFESLNYNFKIINYLNITDVEYVGSFYRDRDAHYGRTASMFNANYIGGKTGDCIKITFKNGKHTRCCFFSVENNVEFLNELAERIEKNIELIQLQNC